MARIQTTKAKVRKECSDTEIALGTLTLAWVYAGVIMVTLKQVSKVGIVRRLLPFTEEEILMQYKNLFEAKGWFISAEIIRHELRRRTPLYNSQAQAEFMQLLRSYCKRPENDYIRVRITPKNIN